MDILSYLSELLQTRKVIGIAGLGTLYKKKKPGRYDIETHSFIPPGYVLDFTSDLKEEEALSGFISKNRGVSTDTSNYFINEFSTALLKELNDHQEVSLGTLGKLVKVNDELKLIPAEESTYGFDFYGLPAVKAEIPTVEEIIPEIPLAEEPVQKEPVDDTPVPANITPAPVTEEPNQKETSITADITPIALETEPILEATLEKQAPDQPVAEEPALASVIADNESLEENPGNEENTDIQQEEARLRAEIEALNFYRSKSSDEKHFVPESLDIVEKLNDPITEAPVPAKPMQFEPMEPVTLYHPEAHTPKASPSYIKIILCIIIFILMLTAAYFVNPQWFQNIIKTTPPAQKAVKSLPTREVYPNPDSASLVTDTTNKTAVPAITATTKDSMVRTSAAESQDTTTVYEIIGASMHDQKEASSFIAQMVKSGIKAKVVTHMSGRRLKISLATLKDEQSAKLELDKLSKKLKIPGIYIYRNKQQ